MNHRMIVLSMTALAIFAGCGGGNGTMPSSAPVQHTAPATQTSSPLGTAQFQTASRGMQTAFAASNGFAVYNFDLDLTTPGTSACTGTCTTFWPPIIEPAGTTFTAPFGTIVRPDGTLQLAYNGHPLSTFAQDTTATTASGDGLNVSGGLWHVAQAASLTTAIGAAASPTAAPTVY
jgi:predicted lipoprotein with Yx(FWY)xxD motif